MTEINDVTGLFLSFFILCNSLCIASAQFKGITHVTTQMCLILQNKKHNVRVTNSSAVGNAPSVNSLWPAGYPQNDNCMSLTLGSEPNTQSN